MRINQRKFIVGIVILSIVVGGYFIYINFSEKSSKICIEDKKCFVIEIVDSDAERTTGLSNRESLDKNKGMLFIFEDELVPGFWMKDMNFPIDIIWISSDFEIVGIETGLQPCINVDSCLAVYPTQPIEYVLEINSNQAEENNITEGDRVYF